MKCIRSLMIINLPTEMYTKYESREAAPVAVPKFRTIIFGKRSLRYEGACLWNCLDNRATVSTILKEFTRHFIMGRTSVHL